MKKPSEKSIKIFKTSSLYLCYFTMGMGMAIPGPCLLDLEKIVNTDTENIAYIYTTRSIGFWIGSIAGGIILDKVKHKQAIFAFSSLVVSVTMMAIPWSDSLGTLIGYMTVNGVFRGLMDTGANVMCLLLWGSESGPIFQAMHFTFGLGSFVAPLIAAPFLGNYITEDIAPLNNDTATQVQNFSLSFVNSNYTLGNEIASKIVYPFSIIGGLSLFVTLMFLTMCFISPTETSVSYGRSIQNSKTSFRFILTLVLFNVLLVFFESAIESGYPQMLTTYVVKSNLQLSTAIGSYMTSAFWAAFTIGRLISVFVAIKYSSFAMLVGDLVVTLVGTFILLFFASHEWTMWLSSIFLGMGVASFFPTAIAWLDTYINVTNKIASMFTVGFGIGDMVIPFAISIFIESFPDVLLYVVFTSCILWSLLILILYMILRKVPKKCTAHESECFDDDIVTNI